MKNDYLPTDSTIHTKCMIKKMASLMDKGETKEHPIPNRDSEESLTLGDTLQYPNDAKSISQAPNNLGKSLIHSLLTKNKHENASIKDSSIFKQV